MFRSSTIVSELVLSLAKVMSLYVMWWCATKKRTPTQSHSAQHTTHTPLPRHAATETCRSDVYVNFSVKLNLSKFNK
jgi:hypothetical protein